MTSTNEILEQLRKMCATDIDSRDGRAFGYAYFAGEALDSLAKQAYIMFLNKNALDPRAFPSLARLEAEVAGRVASWTHMPNDGKAIFTSGGTESIMLAVKSARDARSIDRPNLVAPVTTHGAFRKASEYLGLEFRSAAVTSGGYAADAETLRPLIDENTVLLAASAPEYAHGVVDDIESIGRLAVARGLPLHVDACIGGVLLSGMERGGLPVPAFDFRVPGVTSISIDLHKYAYCPKGASTLLYRDKALFGHQLFVCADWPGYPVVNPTVQSSRTAGPLAAAWAVLSALGDDGIVDLSCRVAATTNHICQALEKIDGVRVLAPPATSLIAFTTETGNPLQLFDSISARRWMVHAQPGLTGELPSLHLTVTPAHFDTWRQFIADVADATKNPSELPQATLQDMLGDIKAGYKLQKGVRDLYSLFMAMPASDKVQFLKAALTNA